MHPARLPSNKIMEILEDSFPLHMNDFWFQPFIFRGVCLSFVFFSWDGGIIHHYFENIYELDFGGKPFILKMNQMFVVHLHSNFFTILFMTSTNFHPKQSQLMKRLPSKTVPTSLKHAPFSRGFNVVSLVQHMKSTRILAPVLITLQELISLRRGGGLGGAKFHSPQNHEKSQVTGGLEIPDPLLFTSKTPSFLQGPLILRVDFL